MSLCAFLCDRLSEGTLILQRRIGTGKPSLIRAHLCKVHYSILQDRAKHRWTKDNATYEMNQIVSEPPKRRRDSSPASRSPTWPKENSVPRARTTHIPVGPAYKRFGTVTPRHGWRSDPRLRFGD